MSVLLSSPLKVVPAAAAGLNVTSGSTWVYGSWVEVIASAAAPLAIVQVVVGAMTYSIEHLELDIGTGLAGAETVRGTVRGFMSNSGPSGPSVLTLRVPIGGIATGERVAVRARENGASRTWVLTLVYVENPDTDQVATSELLLAHPDGGVATIVASTTAWANTAWVALHERLQHDYLLAGLATALPNVADVEIDIGSGSYGAETVLTTVRLTAPSAASGRVIVVHLPGLYPLAHDTRIVARVRTSGTTAGTYTVAMYGYAGPEQAPLPRSRFWIGTRAPMGTTTFLNAVTLDAAGERAAYVVRVPKTGVLNRFGCAIGTVTNVPDNGLRLSFQDVTAFYAPDEVQDHYADVPAGAVTSHAWIEPTGYMGAGGTGTGAKRAVTVGDVVACVIDFASFVAGDALEGLRGINQNAGHDPIFNFTTLTKTAASFSVVFQGRPACFALLYDGDTEYVNLQAQDWGPWQTFTAEAAMHSGSTPDERALRFTLAFDAVIDAIEIDCDLDSACDLVLYDAASVVLASASVLPTVRSLTSRGCIRADIPETALVADTVYRVALKPTVATGGVAVTTFAPPSAAYLSAFEGGAAWHASERTDGGAWTDDPTKAPLVRVRVVREEVAP